MTHWMKTGVALIALAALAGCQSGPTVGGGPVAQSPAPLTPAPRGQVYANQLPPPPAPPGGGQTLQPVLNADGTATGAQTTQPGGTQTAAVGGGGPVTREGLVGAWRVSSGGGNCQIFMALTQWTGGYRAASRGCPGQVADVAAWDVSGSQVVLKDSGGNNVATLSNAGGSRYEGNTTGGQQISLYR